MWQRIFKKEISTRKRRLLNIATFVLFFVAFLSISFFVYQLAFAEKIYGGVYVGPYHLGGKTYLEAESYLQNKTEEFLSQNFEFETVGKTLSVEPVTFADDPGFYYSLVSFDIQKTIAKAHLVGRGENLLQNITDTFLLFFNRKTIAPEFVLDEEALIETLKETFSSLENPPKNIEVQLTFKDSNKPYIKIIPERNGKIFDYEETINTVKNNISKLKQEPIRMSLHGVTPEIKSTEVNNSLKNLDAIFEKTPITLHYENQTWWITKNELASMLTFKKLDSGEVVLSLGEGIIEKINKIAESIEIKPRNAKFVMENDKVIEFQISKDGLMLDKDASVKKIEDIVLDKKNEERTIDLVVVEENPLVGTESVNTMGIKEVVGVGESNFKWSPVNRIHNITVGTEKLHGLIIAPGEEFSLIGALGNIDAAAGFKPELVIKGNKTIAEYGGGLCQIATTMFRAALNAGLEIVERQNHSYRVSYYEPPVGTDATVYNPHPDLRFVNNTGHSLLIQAEINGEDLKYTLWGTDDGRVVEMTAPVIWDITNPPPTKIIETLDLAPGVKKCTERAHKGASVYFDYNVTMPDGELREERFTSFYRPWQEVCLIGVEKLSSPTSTVKMTE